MADLRDIEARLRAAEQTALAVRARTLADAAVDGWLVARQDGLGPQQLQELANQARQLASLHTVVLGGSPDGSAASSALAAKDGTVTAPELISQAARTVGGGGGGKDPERATAGGKDASRLDEALDQIRSRLTT